MSKKELMNKINLAALNFHKTKLEKYKTEWYKLIHEFSKQFKSER